MGFVGFESRQATVKCQCHLRIFAGHRDCPSGSQKRVPGEALRGIYTELQGAGVGKERKDALERFFVFFHQCTLDQCLSEDRLPKTCVLLLHAYSMLLLQYRSVRERVPVPAPGVYSSKLLNSERGKTNQLRFVVGSDAVKLKVDHQKVCAGNHT